MRIWRSSGDDRRGANAPADGAHPHFSRPAREDLDHILAVSLERWGDRGRARYMALISTALRQIGRSPHCTASRDRSEVAGGLRSLHLREVRRANTVKAPVHVVFYTVDPIEIVRVLHERMEPTMHVAAR